MSYSSFPVVGALELHKDILLTETVNQYHLTMQKMDFDISACNC